MFCQCVHQYEKWVMNMTIPSRDKGCKTEQCSGATSQRTKVAGTTLNEINSRILASSSLRPTGLIAMLHCLAVSGLFHLHSSNASHN